MTGLGDAIVNSVKEAAEFERAMLNINTIAKLPAADLKSTGDALIAMGVKFGQSAQTMAEGMYDITSSGFEGADALKVLEAAAKAGTAGLATTGEAASGLAAVLNAYGLKADQAGRVSDVLFKIVERGVITFPELSAAIGTTTALAAPLGVSIEEVGAAIAVLTKHGIDAENSITQINAVMTSMLQPSAQAATLAKELGLQWDVAGLRANGLSGQMGKLIQKTGGSQEKMAVLLGDARAIRGAFVLAAQGGAELTTELGNMADAAGATDAAFGTQSTGLLFKSKQLDARGEELGIRFGNFVTPALNDAAGAVLKAADGYDMLGRAIRGNEGVVFNLPGFDANDKMTPEAWNAIILGPLGQIPPVADAAADAVGKVSREMRAERDAAGGLPGPLADVTGATDDLTDAEKAHIKETEKAAAALDRIAGIADTLPSKLNDLEDALFGDTQRTGDLAQAQKDLAEIIDDAPKKGTRAYRIWQGKVAEAQQALFDLQFQMKQKEGPEAVDAWLRKSRDSLKKTDHKARDFYNTLIAINSLKLKNDVLQLAKILSGRYAGKNLGSIDGRASGGSVAANTPYMVGEEGPELMVPSGSGTIIPNKALGGGGGSTTININVTGAALSPAMSAQFAQQAGPAIADYLHRRGLV